MNPLPSPPTISSSSGGRSGSYAAADVRDPALRSSTICSGE
jgi:hypothetical protein